MGGRVTASYYIEKLPHKLNDYTKDDWEIKFGEAYLPYIADQIIYINPREDYIYFYYDSCYYYEEVEKFVEEYNKVFPCQCRGLRLCAYCIKHARMELQY